MASSSYNLRKRKEKQEEKEEWIIPKEEISGSEWDSDDDGDEDWCWSGEEGEDDDEDEEEEASKPPPPEEVEEEEENEESPPPPVVVVDEEEEEEEAKDEEDEESSPRPPPPPSKKKKKVYAYAYRKKSAADGPGRHPSRKGRPKTLAIYNDGLDRGQRFRLRQRKEYDRYVEEHKAGRVKGYQDFLALINKGSSSQLWRCGTVQDDGMKRGKRCFQRKKAASLVMIEQGTAMGDTPWGKWLQNNRDWDKKGGDCPHCGRRIRFRTSMKRHITFVHQFCASRRKPLSEEEVAEIEEMTRQGAQGEGWRQQRRGRITGTRAGKIWRMTRADPYKLAHNMLMASGSGYRSPAMQRGQRLEPISVQKYKEMNNIVDMQYPVGFCVHPQLGYFGATPDALIGTDGCLEVKCPICPIEDVPKRKGSNFLVVDASGPRGLRMNRKHSYFDQVVMQIICTGRDYCDFAVYYQDDEDPDSNWDLWVERIGKEEAEEAWALREPKLTAFFEKHLGPAVLIN